MIIYIILFGLAAYFYYHLVHKRKGLPPGPVPYPIFGNLLEVLKEPPGEKVYTRWRKQYGNVYTYWMGGLPIVSVTDYKTIMDTFQKDGEAYAGRRPFDEFNTLVRGGPNGVIFIQGELWREQRRFALTVLRDFGLGKNLMEQRILDEIQTIFDQVDLEISNGQKEHDLYDHIDVAVGSIINTLLFNYRFYGDKRGEFFDLKSRVQSHIKTLGHPLVLMSMEHPHFYKNLPYFRHYLKLATDSGQYLMKFFKQRIDEHERNFDEDEQSVDFVHAFLKEWRRKDRNNEQHYFSHNQLSAMCYDLWVAGQETTSNTLAWAFAYMIHNPKIQEKCQEEIDHIIGSDRIINLSDRPNLHYCNATVYEFQRLANLVPQNVPHATTREVTINGYKIPKGITILPQISVILGDNTIYDNPERFDPERFLDNDGKLKRADELIPFSIGKRACLGEGLAKAELGLFFINTINRYKITSAKKLPNMQRRYGATVNIDRYSCRMEKRH